MKFAILVFIASWFVKEPLFPNVDDNTFGTISFVLSLALSLFVKFAPYINFYSVNRKFSQIDCMDGISFEYWCAELLKRLGFRNVRVTKASGDFGADIICYYKNEKVVVQCKRYSDRVNLKSVQEILGAKMHYRADAMIVMTNSYYAPSAIQLAKESGVILWDRSEINRKMRIVKGEDKKRKRTV